MELYFWLILGAILLVSLTILLARPDRTVSYDSEGYLLEGVGSEGVSQSDNNRKTSDKNQKTKEEDIVEEKPPEQGCSFQGRCSRILGDKCKKETPPWQITKSGNAIKCHININDLEKLQS